VLQWGLRLGLSSGDMAKLQEKTRGCKLLGDMCVAGFDWLAVWGMTRSGTAYHRVRVRTLQRQPHTCTRRKHGSASRPVIKLGTGRAAT